MNLMKLTGGGPSSASTTESSPSAPSGSVRLNNVSAMTPSSGTHPPATGGTVPDPRVVQWSLNLAINGELAQDSVNVVRMDDHDLEDYIMVDSGASRATCPPTHAPGHAVQVPKHKIDIRAANGAEIKHYGETHVTCTLPDAVGVPAHAHAAGYQVADVTHPIMGVAEVNDRGHSILFSPAGSFVVPRALTLPEGTPDIPLQRHQNLFWMKAKANASVVAETGESVQLNPLSSQRTGQTPSSSDNSSRRETPWFLRPNRVLRPQ
jgi:hypothetical protein